MCRKINGVREWGQTETWQDSSAAQIVWMFGAFIAVMLLVTNFNRPLFAIQESEKFTKFKNRAGRSWI
jgi:hypothetical protein